MGLQRLHAQSLDRLRLDQGFEGGVGLGGLAAVARQFTAGGERGVEGFPDLRLDGRHGTFGDQRQRLDVLEGRGGGDEAGTERRGAQREQAEAAQAGEGQRGV